MLSSILGAPAASDISQPLASTSTGPGASSYGTAAPDGDVAPASSSETSWCAMQLARLQTTVEVSVSKIFWSGFFWECGSLLAADAGFAVTDSVYFLCAGADKTVLAAQREQAGGPRLTQRRHCHQPRHVSCHRARSVLVQCARWHCEMPPRRC